MAGEGRAAILRWVARGAQWGAWGGVAESVSQSGPSRLRDRREGRPRDSGPGTRREAVGINSAGSGAGPGARLQPSGGLGSLGGVPGCQDFVTGGEEGLDPGYWTGAEVEREGSKQSTLRMLGAAPFLRAEGSSPDGIAQL